MSTNFGATAQAEIDKVKAGNDALLDAMQALILERDVLKDRLEHAEQELASCYETNGHVLNG